jgi:alpha-beta hydrolase superfamily lysophospholipase
MFRDRTLAAWLTALAVGIAAPESTAASAAPVADTGPAAAQPSGEPSGAETVTIDTSDGLKLAASLYLPSRKYGRAPAVLIVHAPDGDRGQVAALGVELCKKGFAVLAVDLRGHGGSASDKPWSQLDRAEQQRMWTYTLRDLDAAAGFLRGRRDIHTTNLTMIGVGSGCALALRHASEDENVRAVVLIAPTDDQLGFDLLDEIQRCGGIPTLFVASRDGRARAKRMVDGLQSAGHPEIDLSTLRAGDDEILADDKTADRVVSYLRQTVVEHKGR